MRVLEAHLRQIVPTLDAVKSKVGIGPVVIGGLNSFGLEVIDVAVGEEAIPPAYPAPPAIIILSLEVIAEPFGDEDFSRWAGYIAASLGNGGYIRRKT